MGRHFKGRIIVGKNSQYVTVNVMSDRVQDTGNSDTVKIVKYLLGAVLTCFCVWVTCTCLFENAEAISNLMKILKTIMPIFFE